MKNVTYKVTTKDGQWSIKKDMTENQVLKFWENNYAGNVGSLNHIISDSEGNDFGYANDGAPFLAKMPA